MHASGDWTRTTFCPVDNRAARTQAINVSVCPHHVPEWLTQCSLHRLLFSFRAFTKSVVFMNQVFACVPWTVCLTTVVQRVSVNIPFPRQIRSSSKQARCFEIKLDILQMKTRFFYLGLETLQKVKNNFCITFVEVSIHMPNYLSVIIIWTFIKHFIQGRCLKLVLESSKAVCF